MIANWMLRFVMASALVTVAAMAAERLLRLWRREARMAWALAMLASVLLGAVSLGQTLGVVPSLGIPVVISAPALTRSGMLLPRIEVAARGSRLDVAIVLAWVLASAGLTARFAIAAHRLHRRRTGWHDGLVDGQRVLVSRDAGPAVVGFRAPVVVIPEWVLGMDVSLRALVLRHEREHLERGDPRLLLGAVALATVAPWNPVLWFELHRLRSAMELDCDRRVLRAHPDARRYGALLLAVAQRADRGALLQAALTESSSLLARRIAAMRQTITSFRVTQSLLLAAAASLAGFVACEIQSPVDPARKAIEMPLTTEMPKRRTIVPADQPYFEFQVEVPVTPAAGSAQPRYPDMLREAGVEGEVLAQFVVDPDGRADVSTFKVLKSSHDMFTRSIRNALPQMRFNPARVGGKAVRQLVQQPFTFSVAR